MPFDPLFLETLVSAALRAELGIAAEAELFYVRFPTPQWPVYDPRLEEYQAVFVHSLDPDATGALPTTWAPGMEPQRLRLIRLRYGDDRIFVEWRVSPAEGPYLQTRHPFTWEGQVLVPTAAENDRAAFAKTILWDLLPPFGRLPDAVRAPALVAGRRGSLLHALVARYRLPTPDEEITQALIAGDLQISVRTLQYWLERVPQRWDALKAEARAQAPLPDTGDL
jgi:hypothetical protein